MYFRFYFGTEVHRCWIGNAQDHLSDEGCEEEQKSKTIYQNNCKWSLLIIMPNKEDTSPISRHYLDINHMTRTLCLRSTSTLFVIWFMNKFIRPFVLDCGVRIENCASFRPVAFRVFLYPRRVHGASPYSFVELIRHGNVVEGIAMHIVKQRCEFSHYKYRKIHPRCVIVNVGFTRTHSYCSNLKYFHRQ